MNRTDNICFCIPARYESTRLDHKLLLDIDGETCISRTVNRVKESKYASDNIFVLTDSQLIIDHLQPHNIHTILTTTECNNGTDRISKHLSLVPKTYDIIVNIQADEPFISPDNIDHAIEKHMVHYDDVNVFYTTLHEERNTEEYLRSRASLKVITNNDNDAVYYSRNIIPWNKMGQLVNGYTYKTFTGIYVFNRRLLERYCDLKDTPLQLMEDCEQLKIIENGLKIKTYPTKVFNEVSLNTPDDYKYLCARYTGSTEEDNKIKFVVFDLDGVFTDGKIYATRDGQMKCYNGKDTYGIKLIRDKNVKTGLITAHNFDGLDMMNHIVDRMDYVCKGKYNKIDVLDDWLKKLGLTYNDVAYIGDDIPDIPVMSVVKFSACPNNAVNSVKEVSKYICRDKGGDGAVREFCEYLIDKEYI